MLFEGNAAVNPADGSFDAVFTNLRKKNGSYKLTVYMGKSEVYYEEYEVTLFDNTAPQITLYGPSVISLYVGEDYIEYGAKATDNADETYVLSQKIVISGSVNTNAAGTYTVRYDVSDENENAAATVERTVNVISGSRGDASQTELNLLAAVNNAANAQAVAQILAQTANVSLLDTAGIYDEVHTKDWLAEQINADRPYSSFAALQNAFLETEANLLAREQKLMYYLTAAQTNADIARIFSDDQVGELVYAGLYAQAMEKEAALSEIAAKTFENAGEAVTAIRQIVSSAYEKAGLLQEVNAASLQSMASVIEKYADIFDIDLKGDYKDMNKEPIYHALYHKSFSTVQEILDAFAQIYEQQYIILQMNRATAGELTRLIKENESVLGVQTSGISDQTMAAIAEILTNQTFSDAADFQTKFHQAKTQTSQTGQSGKPGSGGSSGGGNGHTSSSIVAVDPYVPSQLPSDGDNENGSGNTSGMPLPDVAENHWAADVIRYFHEKGVVSGDENQNFRPEDSITRAEFMKVTMIALGYADETGECNFMDVPEGHWSYPYVAAALARGFITGQSEGNFGADEWITRQDMAVILNRVLTYLNQSDVAGQQSFSDQVEVADYAKQAVLVLAGRGVVNGYPDGTFKPMDTATRAEAVTMLYRFIDGI